MVVVVVMVMDDNGGSEDVRQSFLLPLSSSFYV